jgi:hypothetical protein
VDTSHHRKAIADRKLGTVSGFEWYAFECIGDDAIKFTGAVVTGVVSKGPRKGRKKYAKESRSVVVTTAEEVIEYHKFEAETGRCGDCRGEGHVFASWSVGEGVKHRACHKCKGSGVLAEVNTDAI